MDSRDGIVRAIACFGSAKKLAKAIGFSQGAVSRAKKWGYATAEMATCIEVATNGDVTRLMLRPDVFAPQPRLIKHSWNRKPRKESRRFGNGGPPPSVRKDSPRRFA